MQIDCSTADEKMGKLNPWRRSRQRTTGTFSNVVYFKEHSFSLTFNTYDANLSVDIDTKRAALKTCSSVVSLISYSDNEMLFCGSGTIVRCDADDDGVFASTIFTSASLLRSPTNNDEAASDVKVTVLLWNGSLNEGQILGFSLHYNIAVIKIKSDTPLPTANLRNLDDSVSIYPSDELRFSSKSKKPVLGRHSVKFNLVPGKKVVAVGRYYEGQHKLMVAPGVFSIDYCDHDCKELFAANCKITKCGIGGPLINLDGEVIGINYYDNLYTPFLPINVVSRWWRHFKKHRESRRPSLGMEVTNLYVARVDILEHIVQNFPDVTKGVIVEKVSQDSPAYSAGIRSNDVIVKCGGKNVRSLLELFKVMWNNSGRSVEVVVIRAMDDGAPSRLSLSVTISEAERVNRWPLPHQCLSRKRTYF